MPAVLLFASLSVASAGDLSRCDSVTGGEQLQCFKEQYPAKHSKVRAACGSVPKQKKRACRVREYKKLGLTFRPSSGGGGGGGGGGNGGGGGATLLTVKVVGATIAPVKTSGKDWDGTKISPELGAAVAALATGGASILTGAEGGDATAELLNAGSQGSAAPDVIGYVRLVGPSRPALSQAAGVPMALGTAERKVQDSYTPTFVYNAEYQNWPFLEGSRLEVSLWDADLTQHDPIGVAQVPVSALKAARDKGTIYEFPVADQTSGQVVSIRLSVFPGSAGAGGPGQNGTRWQ